MANIEPGAKVDILERGEWVGPFKVQAMGGRTMDHIILSGPNGGFEMYNDFPFNIRIHVYDQHATNKESK